MRVFGAATTLHSAALFLRRRSLLSLNRLPSLPNANPAILLRPRSLRHAASSSTSVRCSSSFSVAETAAQDLRRDSGFDLEAEPQSRLNVEVRGSNPPPAFSPPPKLSLGDQAFFLLAFIACTTSVAFTSLVIAAVPTLHALGRAATSFAKLADTARLELPSTMAAMRLSSMEISDLTLELSDLSQEIVDGVHKSAQAVQAAEAGIRKIGAHARQQTISIIQERASLPAISLQPVVTGAAKKTSRAVSRAAKVFMDIISRRDINSENKDDRAINSVEV